MDHTSSEGESNIPVRLAQLNVLVQTMDEPIADTAEQCRDKNH